MNIRLTYLNMFLGLLLILSSLIFSASAFAQPDRDGDYETTIATAVQAIQPALIRFETIGGLGKVDDVVVSDGPSTGLLLDSEGYAISAAINFAHQPTAIFARLATGEKVPATIIATDHSRQLTLLKLTAARTNNSADESDSKFEFSFPSVRLNIIARNELSVGQTAIALGRVYDPVAPNISTGIISAIDRVWGKAIQTDAKISAANYGGPLLDSRGHILGILVPLSPDDNSVFAGTEWYDSGIGFAVPLDEVLPHIETLKGGTDLRAGLLGVSLKGSDIYADPAVVTYCSDTSPAWKAGLRAGDKIVAINGRAIIRQAQLKHALGGLYENEKVSIAVERERESLSFEAILAGELAPYRPTAINVLPAISVDVEQQRNDLIIADVFESARLAGLSRGDRIISASGERVKTWNDLQATIARLNATETIKLVVERNGEENSVEVPVVPMSAEPLPVEADINLRDQGGTDINDWRLSEIKVADAANRCYVWRPKKKNKTPLGLLVWISAPGPSDAKTAIKPWREYCLKHNLMLLLPQSLEIDRWQPDEVDFVSQAIANLEKQTPIDGRRISVGGAGTGGAMAGLIVSQRRDLFRGLILLDASLSDRVKLESSPVSPLLVFVGQAILAATATDEATERRLVEKFQQAELPFTFQSKPGQSLETWIEALVQWAATVDRL